MNRLIPIMLVVTASLACAACGSAPATKPALAEDAERKNELAFDAFRSGRYHDAIQLFEEAERYFLGIDHVSGATNAAISLAEVFLLLHDTESAHAAIGRASARADPSGDDDLHDRITLLQARVLHSQGRYGAARWLLEELIQADKPLAIHARLLDCEMMVSENRPGCAFQLKAEPGSLLQARILLLKANAARLQGDLKAAMDYLEQAHAVYRDHRYRPGLADYYESAAYLSGQHGDDAEARERLLRALYLRLWMRDQAHATELLSVLKTVPAPARATLAYENWQQQLQHQPDWEQLRNAVFKRLQAQY